MSTIRVQSVYGERLIVDWRPRYSVLLNGVNVLIKMKKERTILMDRSFDIPQKLQGLFRFSVLALLLVQVPAHAAEANQPALEEVIVTARKRAENMQDTPISVTSISASTIEQAKLFNMKDLQSKTPNLNTPTSSDGSSGSFQAFLRGVGQFDWALTTDPGVGVYVDGVYLARTVGSNLEFSDIERISILRGPQGTLFGKNTIGGAIELVTMKPSGEARHSAKVTVGDYNYTAFDGYLEFPVSDRIAASVSVLSRKSDGWQERNRGDDAGNEDQWGIRTHLAIDFTQTWAAHLVVDHTEVDQNAYPHVLLDFDPDAIFPTLYNTLVLGPTEEPCCEPNEDIDHSDVLNEKDRDITNSSGFSLNNTWDIGDLVLKSITGYRDLKSEVYRDSDNSTRDYFSVEGIFDINTISQEFLLSNNDGSRVDWLLGLYYMKEDGNHTSDVVIAGGMNERLLVMPTLTDFDLFYDRTQVTTSYAAFFNATWHITDKTGLNVAARYTSDRKELDMFTIRRASQTPVLETGPTTPEECTDVVRDGNGSSYNCTESWGNFSPKLGLDHNFSDQVMAYTHVSKGFRSGIYNGRPIEKRHVSIADPELLTSYEIGLKSRFWANRLQLNGAIFYNDYEDQQFLVNKSALSASGSLALVVDNAADSVMRGAELELVALPTSRLMITGGVGWVDAEYKTFMAVDPDTGEEVDLSDREFSHVADWTASLMLQYGYELSNGVELRLRADSSYRSDIYYTADQESPSYELLHIGGHTIHNAGVTIVSPGRKWEFSLFGRNIGDKRVINGGFDIAFFGITDVSYTAPGRLYASLRYNGMF